MLLQRIADALHLPLAALHRPPNAVGLTAHEGGLEPSSNLEAACAVLVHAFKRIRDPAERHRILALVQDAAERS